MTVKKGGRKEGGMEGSRQVDRQRERTPGRVTGLLKKPVGGQAQRTVPRAQGPSSQSLSLSSVTERFRSRTAVNVNGTTAS